MRLHDVLGKNINLDMAVLSNMHPEADILHSFAYGSLELMEVSIKLSHFTAQLKTR